MYRKLPLLVSQAHFKITLACALQFSCSAVPQTLREPSKEQEEEDQISKQQASEETAAVIAATEALGAIAGLVETPVAAKLPSSDTDDAGGATGAALTAAKKHYQPFQFFGELFRELGVASLMPGTNAGEFYVAFESLNSKRLVGPSADTSLVFWGVKDGNGAGSIREFTVSIEANEGDERRSFPLYTYNKFGSDTSNYLLDLGQLQQFISLAEKLNPAIEIGNVHGLVNVTRQQGLLSLSTSDLGWETKRFSLKVNHGWVSAFTSNKSVKEFNMDITATSPGKDVWVAASGSQLGTSEEEVRIDVRTSR